MLVHRLTCVEEIGTLNLKLVILALSSRPRPGERSHFDMSCLHVKMCVCVSVVCRMLVVCVYLKVFYM